VRSTIDWRATWKAVVAEGVETAGVLQRLEELGCHLSRLLREQALARRRTRCLACRVGGPLYDLTGTTPAPSPRLGRRWSRNSSLTRLSSVLIGIVVVRRPADAAAATIGGMPDGHWTGSHLGRARRTFGCPQHGRSGGANGRDATWTTLGEDSLVDDPMGSGAAQIHRIQPYQADKTYICLAATRRSTWDRPPRHSAVSDPSSRRHWHSPLLGARAQRHRPGVDGRRSGGVPLNPLDSSNAPRHRAGARRYRPPSHYSSRRSADIGPASDLVLGRASTFTSL